jgi:glycosyltransferase involved in cell wall biosynthesis
LTIPYSALIRTFNSETTLPDTLRSLSTQTIPPGEYVFVDSGSTDGTLTVLPRPSKLLEFVGPEFNFSEALNQGIKHVSTDYVLIISSHTTLQNCNAIKYALTLLTSDDVVGAAYFSNESSKKIECTLIDRTNFNGFNGLWNTCALIKMELLKRRNFRQEVFSAEDQEWASWLLYSQHKVIARINGAGMDNTKNNNRKAWRSRSRKRLNEYVAIAYFVNRRLLSVFNLFRIGGRVITPSLQVSLRERAFNLVLLLRLLACYFIKPKYRSKYF